MKQPKLSDLKLDIDGTRRMRSMMAKVRKIKITINLDADILERLRNEATKNGTPYQRYLNRLLREAFIQRKKEEDQRIEE